MRQLLSQSSTSSINSFNNSLEKPSAILGWLTAKLISGIVYIIIALALQPKTSVIVSVVYSSIFVDTLLSYSCEFLFQQPITIVVPLVQRKFQINVDNEGQTFAEHSSTSFTLSILGGFVLAYLITCLYDFCWEHNKTYSTVTPYLETCSYSSVWLHPFTDLFWTGFLTITLVLIVSLLTYKSFRPFPKSEFTRTTYLNQFDETFDQEDQDSNHSSEHLSIASNI